MRCYENNSLGDRFPMLAIKPCYFQLAGAGNEIRLTCGGKVSSRSATGRQAAPHTCNVLCLPSAPVGMTPLTDRGLQTTCQQRWPLSHCHPLPHTPLVQLSSSNRLLMKPNEARGSRGKLLQLHQRQKNKSSFTTGYVTELHYLIGWLTDWMIESIDSKVWALQ